MKLSPREIDKLVISQVGWLAQKRLANGVQLNQVEATGLIASQLHELVRTGILLPPSKLIRPLHSCPTYD
jgi:urease